MRKKITFLLLHLGYGGVETATINTANALSKYYDIELVSFYNLKKNQTSRISPLIKVRYLYDGEPNREEFFISLKKHQYFKTIKEAFKSVKILFLKKSLLIKEIKNNHADYIISTRYEFSILLSKYGKKNIKIACEHHYHNNDQKYINILKNKYNNIDYLLALTKTLYDDYRVFLKDNHHTKIVLMPNMLTEIPIKQNKLDSHIMITLSRLDKGKKNGDIIRAFAKLNNKDWQLYILGDGNEYNNLSSLIRELKLENQVKLLGYIKKEDIGKYLSKASIFVMASLTEGLPMVLLEAASFGIPLVAYETKSGVNDIINNDYNGYVIKNRDENEYVEKLNVLMHDDNLRKRLGSNSKCVAFKFCEKEIVEKWIKLLK